MLGTVLFCEGQGTLQAEVGRGKSGDGLAINAIGSLGEYGARVENGTQDGLVVLNGGIGGSLVLIEQALQVFYELLVRSQETATGQ